MNHAQLQQFRNLAAAMNPGPNDWQWIGKWESQRMFGISEERARRYADRFGGLASKMEDSK
jgi:hypothetical protein